MKILCFMGTRPEVIKMAPVVLALKQQQNLTPFVCTTGQHVQMVEQMLGVFGVKADLSFNFDHPEGTVRSLNQLTARLLPQIDSALEQIQPDLVMVHGDTSSTLSCALAAFHRHIPVAHVEAGLRTSRADNPFPEEMNRRLVGRLSTYHFAPTPLAVDHLHKEHIRDHIYLVGNTIVDAIYHILKDPQHQLKTEISSFIENKKIVLVTCHRRESWGHTIDKLCTSLVDLIERDPQCTVIWPVHGNPIVSEPAKKYLQNKDRIMICESLPYDQFIHIVNRANLILTDSGGVLEEAATLGRPVLVLRSETERPEALEFGTGMLVGDQLDSLTNLVLRWLTDPPHTKKTNVFGLGNTGLQIANIINSQLKKSI